MKRFLCAIVAVMLLLGNVGAYSGDTIVYITKTGAKYHNAGCSSLSRSCYEITLSNAVSQGYTPCSKCTPPRLKEETVAPSPSRANSGNSSGGKLVPITPTAKQAALQKELSEVRHEAHEAQKRIMSIESELDDTKQNLEKVKQELEAAEYRAEEAQEKLNGLKATLFWAGVVVGFIGIPLYCVWFSTWRKQELERITAAVRASMEPVVQANYASEPFSQAMPPPKPEPKEPPPPIRNVYDLKGNNPYLREAYRQRYEGKSIAEEAGVPENCGVWFDAEGFPHRKSRQKDDFTVYITDKGKSYHTASCPSAKYGRAVNICYAKQRGLGPCGRCKPMEDLPHWIKEYQRIFRICKAFGIDIKP